MENKEIMEINKKLERIAKYCIRKNTAFICCSRGYIEKSLTDEAKKLIDGKMEIE